MRFVMAKIFASLEGATQKLSCSTQNHSCHPKQTKMSVERHVRSLGINFSPSVKSKASLGFELRVMKSIAQTTNYFGKHIISSSFESVTILMLDRRVHVWNDYWRQEDYLTLLHNLHVFLCNGCTHEWRDSCSVAFLSSFSPVFL